MITYSYAKSKNSIGKYCSTSINDMEPFFKKYKEENNGRTGIKLISRWGFYRFVSGNTTSERYDMATGFKKGFSVVIKDKDKYYIDTDFDPVVMENKVKTASDLHFLVKNVPGSVVKYVSSKKIFAIRDGICTAIIFRDLTPEQDVIANQQLDDIDDFIAITGIERPVEKTDKTESSNSTGVAVETE